MSYKPRPLSPYQRMFVVGAGFCAGTAFVFEGNKLLSATFPIHAYIFFAATISIFLGVLHRYFIFVRVFQTEKSLWALSLSMAITFCGCLTIRACTLGPVWLLYVVVLALLGNLKNIKAWHAIKVHSELAEQKKIILSRVQSGLCLFQSYIALAAFLCWFASTTLGHPFAKWWFGVADFRQWDRGMGTVGGLICLVMSAHLAIRVLIWHREYLKMSAPSAPKAKLKAPGNMPPWTPRAPKERIEPFEDELGVEPSRTQEVKSNVLEEELLDSKE
jgi:hypothetical protein